MLARGAGVWLWGFFIMSEFNAHSQKNSVRKCIAALIVFDFIVASIWLAIDRSWFSVPHFTALPVLENAQALCRGEEVCVYPLLHFFDALCLLLTSFNVWAFAVPGFLSFIVLLFCVEALGRELEFDSALTCLWLCVLAFSPVVFGTMRWYDFHLPLIAAVALAVLLIVRACKKPSFMTFALLAAVMFCGGLLCGGSTPTESLVFWINCGGAVVWFCVARIQEWGFRRGFFSVCIFLIFFCLLFVADMAVVFYLSGWSFDFAVGYYSREIASYWNIAESFSLWGRALFVNVAGLSSAQLGLPFFLLLCAGLPVFMKKESGAQRRLLILCWLFFPLLVFGLLPKKSLVFTNPVVVPAALICVFGFGAIKPGRRLGFVCACFAVCFCVVLSFWDVAVFRKIVLFPGAVVPALNKVSPDYARRARALPEWGREFLDECRERIISDGKSQYRVFLCRSDKALHHLSSLGMELFFAMKKASSEQSMFLSYTGIPVGGDIDFVVSAMAHACNADYLLLDSVSRGFLFDNSFGADFLAPHFELASAKKIIGQPGVFFYLRNDEDKALERCLAFADRMGGGEYYLNTDKLEPADMERCALLLEFMTKHSSNVFLCGEYLVSLVRIYKKLGREDLAAAAIEQLLEMVRSAKDAVFCAEYMTQAAELCRDIGGQYARAVELFDKAQTLAQKVPSSMRRSQMLEDIAVQKNEIVRQRKE